MIEEYKNIKNNASDVYNAYNTIASTAAVVEQEQTMQIVRQLGIEIEKSQLANPGIIKITSENVAKQMKIEQKTHVTTRDRKIAEAVIKQIAAQKLYAEKKRMQK